MGSNLSTPNLAFCPFAQRKKINDTQREEAKNFGKLVDYKERD